MSKVALVVGGGKSLGAFLCKGLAEAGYRVAVADMDADSAKLTASEIAEVHGAENVMAVQANATQEADVQRMVGAVDDRFGRIDLLVLSLAAACVRSARVHAWGAVVAVVLMCGYVAMLFLRLR